jgi:hypothetical protein
MLRYLPVLAKSKKTPKTAGNNGYLFVFQKFIRTFTTVGEQTAARHGYHNFPAALKIS